MTAGREMENGRARSLTDMACSRSSWEIRARLRGIGERGKGAVERRRLDT